MSLPQLVSAFGCPTCTVSAVLQSGAPSLIGYPEFGAPSVPPVLYRSYSTSGGWTLTNTGAERPPTSVTGAGVGATNIGYNADGSSLGGSFDATQTVVSPNETNDLLLSSTYGILSSPATGPVLDGLGGENDPGGGLTVEAAVLSQTQFTLTQSGWTYGGAPNQSVMGTGVFTFTLTDPDSDADALARAEAVGLTTVPVGPMDTVPADLFAAGIFSLWEARIAAATQFGYQAGTYELDCANLVPGLQYHYVVVWEARTAAGNGTGDTSGYGSTWANSDSQSGDFTPGGTTDNVTGLSIPVAAGYQKRIKSITITPVG